MLHMEIKSLSWLLDLEQKSRSFQQKDLKFTELIDNILAESGSSAIYQITDKEIEKPLLQYHETDWEFIRRVASRLHEPIVPIINISDSGLYVGFPSGKMTGTLAETTYQWGLDEKYRCNPQMSKLHYTYYEMEDHIPRQIGDQVRFLGQSLFVSDITARLYKGILCFTYRLTSREYTSVLPIVNASLCGLSITGTVLERQAELLRLHLDIDEEQKREEAYFYTWLPDTGNIMYSMPQPGTKVSLYMQNDDEHSAICINQIRENGSVCEQTQNPVHQYLTTEDGKSISMKPETLELSALTTGTSISLDDNSGMTLSSSSEILIQADKNLIVKSKTVNLHAPKEITAVRRKQGTPSVINLCNNVDTTGNSGKFVATGKYSMLPAAKWAGMSSSDEKQGEAATLEMQEKREALKFKLKELVEKTDSAVEFDLSDIYQDVLSAIPSGGEQDEIAQLSVGSFVLFGEMREK